MTFETPAEDIERALAIERSVLDHERDLYLECMNGIPMSQRVLNPRDLDAIGRDVRDVCILTNVFCHCRPS
jgi:hypothetical protein